MFFHNLWVICAASCRVVQLKWRKKVSRRTLHYKEIKHSFGNIRSFISPGPGWGNRVSQSTLTSVHASLLGTSLPFLRLSLRQKQTTEFPRLSKCSPWNDFILSVHCREEAYTASQLFFGPPDIQELIENSVYPIVLCGHTWSMKWKPRPRHW